MANKKIQVVIVDDFLHCPSGGCHIMRRTVHRWTKRAEKWTLRECRSSPEKPSKLRTDVLVANVKRLYSKMAASLDLRSGPSVLHHA
ncbi:hypothetical protein KIN20_017291 [Parelaphostrongylus tenuis]|uniref:Uncharacterized protein n=1 Tax=Parelaphostrongylus tenuis TaxID=148309 RepID=A0AAD5N2X6_PARTN|nr:hypothetical protein KIN20_017291 [Parelaphostrongylus tenuis]